MIGGSVSVPDAKASRGESQGASAVAAHWRMGLAVRTCERWCESHTTCRVKTSMCVQARSRNHVDDDLGSGLPGAVIFLVGGEYTSRAPGFVPVANVQLLTGTSAVLSSLFMISSVAVHRARAD